MEIEDPVEHLILPEEDPLDNLNADLEDSNSDSDSSLHYGSEEYRSHTLNDIFRTLMNRDRSRSSLLSHQVFEALMAGERPDFPRGRWARPLLDMVESHE